MVSHRLRVSASCLVLAVTAWVNSPSFAEEEYEPSPDDVKIMQYLKSLKEEDRGKKLKGVPLSHGESELAGQRYLWRIVLPKERAYIYITRKEARPTAWAWAESGGKSLPLPDMPYGDPREGRYMQGEVYTYGDLVPGIGVVELSCPNEKWLKSLAPDQADSWGIESMAVIEDPDGYTNIRDEEGNIVTTVKEKEQFLVIAPQPGAKHWEAYLANGIQGYIHPSRVKKLPDEPIAKLNYAPSVETWKKLAKTESEEEEKREALKRGEILYYANLLRASEGNTDALTRFFTKKFDDAPSNDYLADGWKLLHLLGDEKFAEFLRSQTQELRDDIAAMYLEEWTTYSISDGKAYVLKHFPATGKVLYP